MTFVYGCFSDNQQSDSNNLNKISTNIDDSKKRNDNSIKDEDFKTFLNKFSTDEAFQISRIDFPLKVRTIGENSELDDEIMTKEEWRQINFTYDPNNPSNEYEQRIIIYGDKATIECIGIDNGIMVEYYFERKNGIWLLVTLTDAST